MRWLAADERKESEEAGPLHRRRKHALVRSADPRVLGVDDFRLAGNEPLQKAHFLIVDGLQVLRTEKALGHFFIS